MSLKNYRKKRDFNHTPEPLDSSAGSKGVLNFCVQKHDASHLHYDFRLEYKGVLLSWAVPKGPSLNPADKRLAVKVEDHPLSYQYFEGVIPKGNYGAGTVEIWDKGTYRPIEGQTKTDMEKYLTEGLKNGHFAIILFGEKLKGEFFFQKLKKDPDDHAWLLIKKNDLYASTQNDLSSAKKKVLNKHSKLPDFIPPMLATLLKAPFSDDEWLYEIKWDGYRALAFIQNGKVEIKSRNKLSFNKKFPSILHDLEQIEGGVIFDGEIVVLDDKGKSNFQLMQKYQKTGQGTVVYYVFDLLYKDGQDLRMLPLIERKLMLDKYLSELNLPCIRYSQHILQKGEAFFQEVVKNNLEGMVAKKLISTYQSRRSQDWVKVKTSMRQEVVIGGFTQPRGKREKFGALLVGVYDKNEFVYVGHVGGGFNRDLLDDIYQKLVPLIQTTCPFKYPPKGNTKETWVTPKLLGEVSFAEWTDSHIMRQPIFQGLRIDKNPKKVKKEIPKKEIKQHGKKMTESLSKQLTPFTHVDKVYWPQEKYTKNDLLTYYKGIAPFILPYLKNRPIMLHRYPNGILDKEFYQKDINFSLPDGIETYPVPHEGKVDHYLLIDNVRCLLFAVNLGSIDLHPFMSRCEQLDYPDYCVIDLDPHGLEFEKVIEVALVIHDLLDTIQVKHYCKTSGGNGLHILIPLHAKYNYEQSRQFAEIIGHCVHEKLPKITSLERDPKKRPKKVYIDCLQNRYGQTLVAPYAVRPRPGAYVSTPLNWDELTKDLLPSQFTMQNTLKRLKRTGDILLPVLKESVNFDTALKHLQASMS